MDLGKLTQERDSWTHVGQNTCANLFLAEKQGDISSGRAQGAVHRKKKIQFLFYREDKKLRKKSKIAKCKKRIYFEKKIVNNYNEVGEKLS